VKRCLKETIYHGGILLRFGRKLRSLLQYFYKTGNYVASSNQTFPQTSPVNGLHDRAKKLFNKNAI